VGQASRGGNTAYYLPNIDAWRQSWAQYAGCAAPPAGQLFAPTSITPNWQGMNVTS
jgi:hypothetical protein